jgi:hypothetical protein
MRAAFGGCIIFSRHIEDLFVGLDDVPARILAEITAELRRWYILARWDWRHTPHLRKNSPRRIQALIHIARHWALTIHPNPAPDELLYLETGFSGRERRDEGILRFWCFRVAL